MVSGLMTVAPEFMGFGLIMGGFSLFISSVVEEAKVQLERRRKV